MPQTKPVLAQYRQTSVNVGPTLGQLLLWPKHKADEQKYVGPMLTANGGPMTVFRLPNVGPMLIDQKKYNDNIGEKMTEQFK